jgi:hypothetical protein
VTDLRWRLNRPPANPPRYRDWDELPGWFLVGGLVGGCALWAALLGAVVYLVERGFR